MPRACLVEIHVAAKKIWTRLVRCHGLAPWRFTWLLKRIDATCQMPRACPVEIHVAAKRIGRDLSDATGLPRGDSRACC